MAASDEGRWRRLRDEAGAVDGAGAARPAEHVGGRGAGGGCGCVQGLQRFKPQQGGTLHVHSTRFPAI